MYLNLYPTSGTKRLNDTERHGLNWHRRSARLTMALPGVERESTQDNGPQPSWKVATQYYGERYHRGTTSSFVRCLSSSSGFFNTQTTSAAAAHDRPPAAHTKHVPQLQNRETKDKQNRTKMVSHNVLLFIHLRCLYATQETSRSLHQFG